MVDLRTVDLNLLVALDVLLDERSVRSSARRLHVTPSTMSHTLGRIRALLDDPVLVRAGRRMVATPRAEALIRPLRAWLTEGKRVLAQPAPFSPSTLQRAFRVLCTDHVSIVLLPHVEDLLAQEAPNVDLYVCPQVPEAMEQLRAGAVDVAVGVHPVAPPEMHRQRLFDDRYVTVVRPAHPRIRGPQLTLEDYLAEPHVLVAPGGSPEGPIDTLLAEQGHARRVARTRPNFLAALALVEQSDTLLTVSRRIVEAARPRFDLRVLPTPLPTQAYALSMLWHPRLHGERDQAWFREVLRRAAGQLDP